MPVSYRKLFDTMDKKGITKNDLRSTFKFNPKTIASLTFDKSVTVDTIIELCDILDCQPGDVMERVSLEEWNQMQAAKPKRQSRKQSDD